MVISEGWTVVLLYFLSYSTYLLSNKNLLLTAHRSLLHPSPVYFQLTKKRILFKKIKKMLKKTILLTTILGMFSSNAFSKDLTIDGNWKGNIKILEANIDIIVDIDTDAKEEKYSLKIPIQTNQAFPLSNFSKDKNKVHFEFKAPKGTAIFEGVLDKEKIKGKFIQNGVEGNFEIERNSGENTSIKKSTNNYYKEESVIIPNGDIKLAGTLTLPKTGSNFTTIVLITGSGPENRDEELFGFKPFEMIADNFTKKGFAVLRCDDRGVGESTGDFSTATSYDFSTDIEAMVNYLKTRKEINPKKIGVLGHSEGGMIVNLLASRNKNVAFGIMMAGTSVNGKEILESQNELISKVNGATAKEMEGSKKLATEIYKLIFDDKTTDKDWLLIEEKIKAEILKESHNMKKELKDSIKNLDEYASNSAKSILALYKSEWMTYFIKHDPIKDIEKVNIPVLALFGEKDLQVEAKLNINAMNNLFKKTKQKNYTIKTLKEANHFFQKANSGSPSEYETLDKKFVDDFFSTIEVWLSSEGLFR